MFKHGGGAIINISSGAGVQGFKNQAAYAAAKHGVIWLTKCAARNYAAQNIRFNAKHLGIYLLEVICEPLFSWLTVVNDSQKGRRHAR